MINYRRFAVLRGPERLIKKAFDVSECFRMFQNVPFRRQHAGNTQANFARRT